jgi:hypothetical protein
VKRIKLILVAAATIVAMVLFFTVPALAYGPHGLIGEGRVDVREGQQFIKQGTDLGKQNRVNRGEQAIQEGQADIRQGQRGIGGH